MIEVFNEHNKKKNKELLSWQFCLPRVDLPDRFGIFERSAEDYFKRKLSENQNIDCSNMTFFDGLIEHEEIIGGLEVDKNQEIDMAYEINIKYRAEKKKMEVWSKYFQEDLEDAKRELQSIKGDEVYVYD